MPWRRGTVINFGGYVGHTPVRLYVLGDDAYERKATDDEIRRMKQVVADSINGGASASRAIAAASTSVTAAGPCHRSWPAKKRPKHSCE